MGQLFAFKVDPKNPKIPQKFIHLFPGKIAIGTFFLPFFVGFQMPAPHNIGDRRKSDSTHPDSLLKAGSICYLWTLILPDGLLTKNRIFFKWQNFADQHKRQLSCFHDLAVSGFLCQA